VFYRLTPVDIVNLSGPQFFALTDRVFAYQGVLSARASAQSDGGEARKDDTEYVDSNRESMESNPALAGLVEW